jgi:hypothetical protein
VVCGVNEIPKKSLCKFVDDCGKNEHLKKKERKARRERRKEFYTEIAASTENAEKGSGSVSVTAFIRR